MFGLFESQPFFDQELGELVRSRGMWRGTVRLESEVVPLALAGGRSSPEAAAVAIARDVRGQHPVGVPRSNRLCLSTTSRTLMRGLRAISRRK